MKKCPYCGAEYCDKLIACPVDQNPLVDSLADSVSAARRKLPLSLSLLTYLLLIPAAQWLYPVIAHLSNLPRFIFFQNTDAPTMILVLGATFWLIFGALFYVTMFVALRRGSRFAYFLTWLGYSYVYWRIIYENLLPLLGRYGDYDPNYWWAAGSLCLGMVVFLLPFYVLLRRDVRQFFFNSRSP